MKIKPKDYEKLKSMVEARKEEIPQLLAKYAVNPKCKNPAAWLQYDLCKGPVLAFICDELYKYLNDSHIKTAFKQIFKELQVAIPERKEHVNS